MATGYGSYDPNAPDPVLEARRAAFRQRAIDEAAAQGGLDQMNARAGTRYDTGIGTGALPGVDVALPQPRIVREAQRLSPTADTSGPPSRISRAAAPPSATPPPQPSAPPSPIARASQSLTAARHMASTYSRPEWGGVGGGTRSAAQMEQDIRAHDLIDRGYKQGVEENGYDEQVRGNPMDRAIDARKRTLGYEDLLPADATSHVRFGTGSNDRDFMDYPDQQAGELGAPTMGEARTSRSAIAQAAARQNPKDVSEAALGMGRGRLAEELDILRRQLQAEVRAGKRTREDAAAEWAKASDEVKTMAEVMKTGFPRDDPFATPATPSAPPAGYGPTVR